MLADGPLRRSSPAKSGPGLKLRPNKIPAFKPTPTPDTMDNHRGVQRANTFKRTVAAQAKDTKGNADMRRGLPFLGRSGAVLHGSIYPNAPTSSTRPGVPSGMHLVQGITRRTQPTKGQTEDPVLGLAYDVIDHPERSNLTTIMNLAHQGYVSVSKGDQFKLATGRHDVSLEPGPRIGGDKKTSIASAGAGDSVAAPYVAPALWGLKQSTRPLQGGLRAVDATLKGGNPAKAALQGLELKGKNVWGTDIAHDIGLHGTAATVAGVGIDLLASKGYPKFGLGSPAKLLRERGERAAEAGDQAGASKLFARAEQASQGRAPQIGHDFHIPFTHKGYDVMTTGEAPGRILKAIHGDKDRLRATTLGKVLGNFNPGMRPAGLSDALHTADRRRLLKEQAEVAQRTTQAERELHVLSGSRQKGAAGPHVFDTAERAPLVPLTNLVPKQVPTELGAKEIAAQKEVNQLQRRLRSLPRKLAKAQVSGNDRRLRALVAEHRSIPPALESATKKVQEFKAKRDAAGVTQKMTRYFTPEGLTREEAYAQQGTASLGHDLGFTPGRVAKHPNGRPVKDSRGDVMHEPGRGVLLPNGKLVTEFESDRTHADMLRDAGTTDQRVATVLIRGNGDFKIQSHTGLAFGTDSTAAEAVMRADPRLHWINMEGKRHTPKDIADIRKMEVQEGFTPKPPALPGFHAPGHLNPAERKQLAFLERRNQTILGEAQKAGLMGKGRENYIRHTLIPAEGNRLTRFVRGSRKSYAPAAHRGYGELTAKEINAMREVQGKEPIISRNPLHAQATRENEHAIAMAHANSMKALVRLASPAKAADWGRLPADRGFYRITPSGLSEVTSEKNLHDAMVGSAVNEHEHVVVLPRQIADQEISKGARQTSDVGRAIDRIMGPIKTLYTSLNIPKHDVSNLQGDVFNGYLAGTRLPDYNSSAAVIARMFQRSRAEKVGHVLERNNQYIRLGYGRRMHIDDVIDNLRKHGIEGGFVSHGLREEATAGVSHISNPGALAQYRRGEGYRENFTRVATGLGALRRGMTWDQAAEWVAAHHFNYTDLTGAEHVLRRAFPFYTFAARNTKLQVRSLLSNPGKYAAVESLRQELAKASGLPPDWENHVKPSVAQGIPFPIKWSNGKVYPVVIGGLPLQDLNRLPVGSNDPNHFGPIMDAFRNEFDKTASNLNMVLKPLVELGMNHNVFFRGPIYPDLNNTNVKRYVPAPSWAQHLPTALKDVLGVHMIVDNTTGKKMVGWNSVTDYLVRSIPQTNLAVQFFQGKTRNSRGQTLDQKLLAQAFNLNGSDEYGNPTQALNDLYNELDHITLEKNSLEERGGKFSQPWAMLRLRERVLQGRIKATRAGAASGAASAKPASTGGAGSLTLPGGLSSGGGGLASPSSPLRRP